LEEGVAVKSGHHNIAEDQIRTFFLSQFEALLSIFGGEGLKAFHGENGQQVAAHRSLIFNDENLFHFLNNGSVTMTVVPWPCLLCT
jgi:hypothetical protein